jgi:hypothetical protein
MTPRESPVARHFREVVCKPSGVIEPQGPLASGNRKSPAMIFRLFKKDESSIPLVFSVKVGRLPA